MAALAAVAAIGFSPQHLTTSPGTRMASSPIMETAGDLEVLAKKLNPVLGFYDPLELSSADFFGMGEAGTIGWLRHAEIKHGRVAMAAFIGYIVGESGVHFPWALGGGVTYADIAAAGSPKDQWDALPTVAKLQILAFIGFLEFVGENSDALAACGEKHYTKGGKPGFFPSIKSSGIVPHPVPLDLYDPIGTFGTKMSEEAKAKGLVTEINNGRLAMIGIMGFVAAAKVPGSVPALAGVVKPYAGEVMGVFSAADASLPFVSAMVKYPFF